MNKLGIQIKVGKISPKSYISPIKFSTNYEDKSVESKIHYTPKLRKHKPCDRKLLFSTNISKQKANYVDFPLDNNHKTVNIPSIIITSPKKINYNTENVLNVDYSLKTTGYSKNMIINTPDRSFLLANGVNVNKSNDILGRGSFGVIVQGKYNDQNIALKIIPIIKIGTNSSLIREKNAIGLNHPNIVKIFEIICNSNSEFITVLMEDCSVFNNLQYLIDDYDYLIDNLIKVKFTLNICNGLKYCHKKHILHLDIKPLNILINSTGKLKICDFGASIKTSHQEQYRNYKNGTIKYTAPEILMGLKPTEKSDVYSVGVTMWQLHYRRTPYEGINEEIIIYNVVKKHLRPQLEIIPQGKYIEIFQSCWASSPENRPTIGTIMKDMKQILGS